MVSLNNPDTSYLKEGTYTMLEITLVKSIIGTTTKQRAVVRGLGLRHLNHMVVLQDNPVTQGMIKKIRHMLKVK